MEAGLQIKVGDLVRLQTKFRNNIPMELWPEWTETPVRQGLQQHLGPVQFFDDEEIAVVLELNADVPNPGIKVFTSGGGTGWCAIRWVEVL